jgi:hypothetical protein
MRTSGLHPKHPFEPAFPMEGPSSLGYQVPYFRFPTAIDLIGLKLVQNSLQAASKKQAASVPGGCCIIKLHYKSPPPLSPIITIIEHGRRVPKRQQ